MKINILSNEKGIITFQVDGITPAFANTLRRIMISEVPVLAIRWVDFENNTSPMFDEMVAHRIGLIPLKFDPSKFNFRENCKCDGKGCPLCQVIFAVEKTGPGTVLSGDMKSSNKDVAPTSPDFPIAALMNGHEMKFEAVAELGTGKEHSKWQPAIAAYSYIPELSVDSKKCNSAELKKCANKCPKGILEVSGDKIVLKEPEKCDLCKACEDACECLRINGKTDSFVFKVETISGLDPEYIVEKAVEILSEKAKQFQKKLAKI